MLGNLFNTRHEIWKGSHWKLARGRVPNVGLSCNRNVPRHFRMTYEQKFFGVRTSSMIDVPDCACHFA
jgi:hypothetical protein